MPNETILLFYPFFFIYYKSFVVPRILRVLKMDGPNHKKEENYLILGGLVLVFIGIVGYCFLSAYSSHTEYLMHLEPSIP